MKSSKKIALLSFYLFAPTALSANFSALWHKASLSYLDLLIPLIPGAIAYYYKTHDINLEKMREESKATIEIYQNQSYMYNHEIENLRNAEFVRDANDTQLRTHTRKIMGGMAAWATLFSLGIYLIITSHDGPIPSPIPFFLSSQSTVQKKIYLLQLIN